MALFVLRKLILQTCMHSHPVGLDVWFLIGPFVYFHTLCANSKGSGETAWMRRLAWAFAGRLCDKYHNIMSWLFKHAIVLNVTSKVLPYNCLKPTWESIERTSTYVCKLKSTAKWIGDAGSEQWPIVFNGHVTNAIFLWKFVFLLIRSDAI